MDGLHINGVQQEEACRGHLEQRPAQGDDEGDLRRDAHSVAAHTVFGIDKLFLIFVAGRVLVDVFLSHERSR